MQVDNWLLIYTAFSGCLPKETVVLKLDFCPLNPTPTAINSSEFQRLTEDVTEVIESIKDLSNLLQAFGDQLAQIRESLGDVERKVTLEVKQCIQNEVASLSNAISSLNCNDYDETLTCSKLASPALTKKIKYQQLCT